MKRLLKSIDKPNKRPNKLLRQSRTKLMILMNQPKEKSKRKPKKLKIN